jgi:WD40 repeat protein
MNYHEENTFAYKPSSKTKDETIAKDRNKGRINCVSANPFGNRNSFFTGTPKFVQLWSSATGKMERHWKADDNDWVYCIEPLSPDSMLTVIGSRLERWSQIYRQKHQVDCIFSLPKTKDGPRPFISSILRLDTQRNLVPCAIFDGSVQVVNLDTSQVVLKYQEHQKRVWTVIELAPQIVASCADDSLIKIWDLRQKKSQLTLGGNPGRVSCLLKLDENEFVSASCPDNVFQSADKAQLSFWDMRMINPVLQPGDL